LDKNYDVIVIGAGIVGISTALHLLMRGKRVLLMDRGAAGQETSFGNAGIIETSYVLPFGLPPHRRMVGILLNRDPAARIHYLSLPQYIAWIIDFYFKSQSGPRQINGKLLRPLIACALEEHRVLMRNTDADRHLSMAGRVKLHRSEASFSASDLERRVATEMGVPFEVMSAKEFQEIEPFLRPIYHKAVRWTCNARLTNPGAVMAAYADRFVRDGGVFQQTRAMALRPMNESMWCVETEQGKIIANDIVVCTGPWASDFFKPLGYRFPLGIKRGYHQHFSAIGAATLSHAIVDADIGYVLASMEQGYRVTTGVEFSSINNPAKPVQISRIMPYLRELFPIGDPIDPKAWLGNRPCFTDSLPIIGPAPKHKGLWFNFGHGHSGLTIGPPSGRLLAEMLCASLTFCDPAPYRADRFA